MIKNAHDGCLAGGIQAFEHLLDMHLNLMSR